MAEPNRQNPYRSMHMGLEFAGAALVMALVGYYIDTQYGSKPWGALTGATVGFAAVGIGVDAVQWDTVGEIVMSWVASPLLAGFLAYLIYLSVQLLILRHEDPVAKARRYVPAYIFLAAFTVTLVTILKGLKHVGPHGTGINGRSVTDLGAQMEVVRQ